MDVMELAGFGTSISNMSSEGNSTKVQHNPETHASTYISMVMIGVLSVCGMFGNSLVIYVFSKQKQKLSSTIFIITLAVTDFLVSIITMPTIIAVELLFFKIEYDVFCKLFMFSKTSVIPFSALIMVAIAVDRYLIIVHPLKNLMTIDRAKKAKYIVLLLSIFAVFDGVLGSLTHGTYDIVDKTTTPKNITRDNVNFTHSDRKGYDVWNNSDAQSSLSVTLPSNEIIYHGFCVISTVIVSARFVYVYQKVYCGVFGICAVVVTILYALIYKTVINQRRKRNHLGSFNTTSVTTDNNRTIELVDNKKSSIDHAESNDSGDQRSDMTTQKLNPDHVSKQNAMKVRDANLKTAFMLFIVAFIYIIAFTPAWMMALDVIEYNPIVYYLYFVYNVANPVIYAFLNKDFRSHLRQLFTGRI